MATSRDPQFKSWCEVMQEKGAAAQQGSYCKGNTNASQQGGSVRRSSGEQHSQASSNRSHHAPVVHSHDPAVQSGSVGRHSDSTPSQFPRPIVETEQQQQSGLRQSECPQVQVERAKAQAADQQNPTHFARATEGLLVATLETIMFDLNAEPGGDIEMHVYPLCDLSLKLSIPTLGDQPKKDGAGLPSASQLWRPLASILVPLNPIQPTSSSLGRDEPRRSGKGSDCLATACILSVPKRRGIQLRRGGPQRNGKLKAGQQL